MPRKIGDEERVFIHEAIKVALRREKVKGWRDMPLLKRHLMGIAQDVDNLPFTAADEEMFK